jgi:hypothetical protein
MIAYFKVFNKFLLKIEIIPLLFSSSKESMLKLLFKQQTSFKFIADCIVFNLNKN